MINLSVLLFIPLLTIVIIFFSRNHRQIRWVSFVGACIQLIAAFWVLIAYMMERATGNTAQMVFQQQYSWFSTLNIEYYIGIDGISATMIVLTALIVFAGVLLSWNVKILVKEFFILLFFLSLGAFGFFISLDLFTMFFFLELAVIPKYLLIARWGSGNKEYSALKLALMLMSGSALILIGLVTTYYHTGSDANTSQWAQYTWNVLEISQKHIPLTTQLYIFPFLFVGFGIFTALFPFHTWVPDGHSSAPTAASMFLAGISMKLGGYGALRVAVYLMPDAAQFYSWIIVLLATIAIIYGSFATLMQKDLKYMNAYSSVSHCGFILLGIGMLTTTAVVGAVIQMISHGIMTALFFGAIGMLYERTHTRQISELGGLFKTLPFIGIVFSITGFCSLGLPGLSGFVAEMTIFVGSWQRPEMFYRMCTSLAVASIVVTAVYILRAAGKTFMGALTNEHFECLRDATWNEKIVSVVFIVVMLIIGIAPFWLYNLLLPDAQILLTNIRF